MKVIRQLCHMECDCSEGGFFMSTPHNEAKRGEIAPIVLMPGDPLRAKYIAEQYLEDVVQFNAVRNMFGYTGTYQGKRVSVMGSGMGMPSIGIYSYELFTQYDVEVIIRVGSAGAYHEDYHLFDVVVAKEAWSESSFAYAQSKDSSDVQYPSDAINQLILECAEQEKIAVKNGRIHSSDVFYHEANTPHYSEYVKEHGCVCVEMESFALFHNAKVLGKDAACILTISDSFVSSEETTAKQRETSFHQMMKLALKTAIRWYASKS